MGLAIVALEACVATAGMSQIAWTIGLGVIAVVAAVGGSGSVWVFLEGRRGARVSRQSPAHLAEFF